MADLLERMSSSTRKAASSDASLCQSREKTGAASWLWAVSRWKDRACNRARIYVDFIILGPVLAESSPYLEHTAGLWEDLSLSLDEVPPLHLRPVAPARAPHAEHHPLHDGRHHLALQVLQLLDGLVEDGALKLQPALLLHPLLLQLEEEGSLGPAGQDCGEVVHRAQDRAEVGLEGILLLAPHQLHQPHPKVLQELQLQLKEVKAVAGGG